MRNIVLACLAAALVATAYFGVNFFNSFKSKLAAQVFNEREIAAQIAASSIKTKLVSLQALSAKYADDQGIISDVASAHWDAALQNIKSKWDDPSYYDYYMDRITLLDASGTVKMVFPGEPQILGMTDPDVSQFLGKDALVGGVEQRPDRTNYIPIVSSVKKGAEIVGYVELMIPLNSFSDFGKDIDKTSSGFTYFVDREGNIISHPRYSSDGPVVNYANVPSVKAILSGTPGVSETYNPVEQQLRVTAFEKINPYGWGLVSTEASKDAFAERNTILRRIILGFALLALLEVLVGVYIILRNHEK